MSVLAILSAFFAPNRVFTPDTGSIGFRCHQHHKNPPNPAIFLIQNKYRVKKKHEKVDILFVNAGIFQPAPVGQISEEMFDHQMGINFKGAVFTTEKFLPILTSRGCPYKCTFCISPEVNPTWRPRSAINVVDEMEYFYNRLGITDYHKHCILECG